MNDIALDNNYSCCYLSATEEDGEQVCIPLNQSEYKNYLETVNKEEELVSVKCSFNTNTNEEKEKTDSISDSSDSSSSNYLSKAFLIILSLLF